MGYTMTAQQPYPDFNKEKITDQSENSVDDKGTVIILGDLNIISQTKGRISRFISRTKRFRPFGYACLSVGLLQSSVADCTVHCRRL